MQRIQDEVASQPFRASDHAKDGRKHLLLAASGSVATIKIPNIIHALSSSPDISVRLLLTKSASEFLSNQSAEQPSLDSLAKLPCVDGVHRDEDEWSKLWQRGDSIQHIELRRWADVLAIIPLSANTMAKMVAGISNNLLLSVVRAWDTTGEVDGKVKRILVAPAMNTAMWRHPVTRKHVRVLQEEWGGDDGWVEVLPPMEKELACGDVGDGAMMDWKEIAQIIKVRLGAEPVVPSWACSILFQTVPLVLKFSKMTFKNLNQTWRRLESLGPVETLAPLYYDAGSYVYQH